MTIEKPIKRIKKELRKELQANLILLRDQGYTWNQLVSLLDEHINFLGGVAKHGEDYSISIEKTQILIDKTKNIINSL